jgi:hypothetical protein
MSMGAAKPPTNPNNPSNPINPINPSGASQMKNLKYYDKLLQKFSLGVIYENHSDRGTGATL